MNMAIQGHLTRGKEVIQILESLGGINTLNYLGNNPDYYYKLHENSIVCSSTKIGNYKYYTLEEFEKEFPFKIGDKVKYITSICIIRKYCYINNKPVYEVESMEFGIIATIPVEMLEPCKEMKEERNITLTLDKAKEWYKKGGELKEIALQAFAEKELNPLPRSWEEFCETFPIDQGEAYINSVSKVIENSYPCNRGLIEDRNACPSTKSAEAHLAMIQLEQLRNCWWNDWEPEYNCNIKYIIKWDKDDLIITTSVRLRAFLIFPTREIAEEFLECFRGLIEKAGDLI